MWQIPLIRCSGCTGTGIADIHTEMHRHRERERRAGGERDPKREVASAHNCRRSISPTTTANVDAHWHTHWMDACKNNKTNVYRTGSRHLPLFLFPKRDEKNPL